MELDGYKFLSDDVSPVPDAAHFSPRDSPAVGKFFDFPPIAAQPLCEFVDREKSVRHADSFRLFGIPILL